MHPVRKQRLLVVIGIVVVSSIAIGLLVFALRDNLNLFYPPSKIVAGQVPLNKTIRAGGCVVPGSVEKASDSLRVTFEVTDGVVILPVTYEGILPDLFMEGEAAVMTGQQQENGVFKATRVLAKHDENYTPPEVAEAMTQKPVKGNEDHTASCDTMSYGATYDS